MHGLTSAAAQSVVGGTSPGNQYQNAGEAHINYCIPWMNEEHPVDVMKEWNKPQIRRNFTPHPNPHLGYNHLVTWITLPYNPTPYLHTVDFCLVSTMSTHGDSPLFRFALIDSRLNLLSSDNNMTFTGNTGCQRVTFNINQTTAMVEDTDNKLKYININPYIL